MTRITKSLTLLAATCLATTAFAVTPDKGAVLGTDAVTISAALAEDGFKLVRYKSAPALIQVTAMKDSRKHLILVSARDGAVISHKTGSTIADHHAAPQPAVAPAGLAEKLAAHGYHMVRVKNEGHELEVYAMRDGQLWELKLDPATGTILHSEADD